MDLRLQPLTEPGQQFCQLAEVHAKEAAGRAERHDQERTFPVEVFDSMKASGFLKATVPEEFGGGGLRSAHDVAAGLARLARGDGSVAIAANMHLAGGLVFGRVLARAREMGHDQLAGQASGLLSALGSGAVAAANITESGTDYRHPLVEAVKVEGGWSITGRKTFGTLSAVADLFLISFRARRDATDSMRFAVVARDSRGQTILDNWDALGMRASASHDIVYEDCFVADDSVLVGTPWGEDDELTLVIARAGNLGLVGCFLGIAEGARDLVVDLARTRTKAPTNRPIAERPGIQHQVAEMEADLETCRAMVERAGRVIDELLFARPSDDVTLDDLHRLHSQYQCAKLVANRRAIDVVDRGSASCRARRASPTAPDHGPHHDTQPVLASC